MLLLTSHSIPSRGRERGLVGIDHAAGRKGVVWLFLREVRQMHSSTGWWISRTVKSNNQSESSLR